MKRMLICMTLVLMIYGSLYPAFSQPKDQILFGFTNVSQAVMLHPTMARYRIKEGRFSPAAIDGKDKKATSRLEEFEKQRKELLDEKKKLEALVLKADQDLSKALAELNVKFNSKRKDSSPEKHSDQYNKEKNSLENKFWVQRQELQVKLSDVENKLARNSQENELLHLTSAEETERVFKSILDDVYEAIDMVSKHYKVNFVFNTSFTVERTPVNPSFTPINPMGEFFATTFKQDAGDVLFKHGSNGEAPFSMTLDYWIACQRWAFRTTADPRLDKLIIKGGLDMTPAVVDYVYQKHNVPASHRDIIQEFLKKQVN